MLRVSGRFPTRKAWMPGRATPPHHGAAPQQRRAGTFYALRYRNYRLFWLGQVVSVTGTFMQSTAQQWLVLTLSKNPLALGLVGALQFGPLLVLGPFGGAIADHWPRRNILVLTQASAAVLAIILWALTSFGVPQLWEVYVLALCLGFVNAVDMPTRQAFVSEMVPGESLLNALSLNSAQFNVSRIAGPGVAGAMIALFGIPPMFLFNGVSYLAVIAGLLMMRPQDLVPVPRRAVAAGARRFSQLSEGLRYVVKTPIVRVTILMAAVMGAFGFNMNVLVPLFDDDVLHAGPAIFGVLTSALGVGALCGALMLARRDGPPTDKLLVIVAAGFGTLEASLALTHSVVPSLLQIALMGFFMSSFGASANTRTQLNTPPEMRGRVMSVYMMVFAGSTPIGNLMISGMAGAAGMGAAFLLAGVPCVLVAGAAAWMLRAVPNAPRAAYAVTRPSPAAQANGELADTPPMAEQTPPALGTPRSGVGPGASGRHGYRAPGLPHQQPRAADHD